MRLRKKKHLDERIDASGDYLIINEHIDFYRKREEDRYSFINISDTFSNDNPVWLEIGCGKGGFVEEMARLYPDINFIAVEKIANVIICAIDKARESGLKNVRFLCCDASNLGYYIHHHSVDRIFLNFSCPWPKHRYENQRLTNARFLRIYDRLLTERGEIWQKTDSQTFFEYSIAEISAYGFALKNVSCDLHHSDCDYNVMTEYERYFSGIGKPIYRLEAYRRG